MKLAEQLSSGISALGLELPKEALARMGAYLTLLAKWNRIYNLTAVRDEATMVTHHLLDSLAVAPYLAAAGCTTLADVGSGGGLPGIPLAIAMPELDVTLIESVHKKTSFLQQAKIELKLANISIFAGRVEEFAPVAGFDAVISRAFSELALFVSLAGHLIAPGGRLLAMKGNYPDDEIVGLPSGWQLAQTVSLAVPGLVAQRHLIVIEKN